MNNAELTKPKLNLTIQRIPFPYAKMWTKKIPTEPPPTWTATASSGSSKCSRSIKKWIPMKTKPGVNFMSFLERMFPLNLRGNIRYEASRKVSIKVQRNSSWSFPLNFSLMKLTPGKKLMSHFLCLSISLFPSVCSSVCLPLTLTL